MDIHCGHKLPAPSPSMHRLNAISRAVAELRRFASLSAPAVDLWIEPSAHIEIGFDCNWRAASMLDVLLRRVCPLCAAVVCQHDSATIVHVICKLRFGRSASSAPGSRGMRVRSSQLTASPRAVWLWCVWLIRSGRENSLITPVWSTPSMACLVWRRQ